MLAFPLIVIIGKGYTNRVVMFFNESVGKSAEMLFPKDILIDDASKENPSLNFRSVRYNNVPIVKGPTACVRGEDVLYSDNRFQMFAAPFTKFRAAEKFGDLLILREIVIGTQSPTYFNSIASSSPKIVNNHIPRPIEHIDLRSMLHRPLLNPIFIPIFGDTKWRTTDEIGAHRSLGSFVSAAHLIKADESQNISEVNKSNISKFDFLLTKKAQVFIVAIIGFIFCTVGLFLPDGVGESLRVWFIGIGIIITFAGPYMWLLFTN